ncbi:hypothetical protein PFISCL1PPCAC_15933, partial [Pristionchus fissidentatus]
MHFVRYLDQGETHEDRMLFSRLINGHKFVYQACDDPKDGIEVDVKEGELEGCCLRAIHRRKLIYVKRSTVFSTLPFFSLSPNIYVVMTLYGPHVYSTDDSPLIYCLMASFNTIKLSVLNTVNMQGESFHLIFGKEKKISCNFIVGVHNGKISLRTKVDDEFYPFTANCPMWEDLHELEGIESATEEETENLDGDNEEMKIEEMEE